jgi:hypothetical protein
MTEDLPSAVPGLATPSMVPMIGCTPSAMQASVNGMAA